MENFRYTFWDVKNPKPKISKIRVVFSYGNFKNSNSRIFENSQAPILVESDESPP